jgi:hypothetical protein
MARPSSVLRESTTRESTTRESTVRQNGQFTATHLLARVDLLASGPK